ncbi:MAG: pilus assembly protein [Myxococcales bacterium]
MKRSPRRKLGVVSVEIVVMLPVFVALLGAVIYLHQRALAVQAASLAARTCAWTYALKGCEMPMPKVCDRKLLGSSKGWRVSLPGSQVEFSADGVDFHGSYFDMIAEIPVFGAAVKSVFGVGERIYATKQTPQFMRSGKETVEASMYVLCNTRAETWTNNMGQLFDQLKDCSDKKGRLCN